MTVATAAGIAAARHALVLPDCDCGTCGPTWARRRGRSRRFTEPVTLASALAAEAAAGRAGMVREHLECLWALTGAAAELIVSSEPDDVRRPGLGLALVLFGGELASAISPEGFGEELPAELVAACNEAETAAMMAAAGCLASMVGFYQALTDILG